MTINLITKAMQVRLEKLGATVGTNGSLTATEEQMWRAPLNPYIRVQLEKQSLLTVS